jgi:hypothetical protein
MQQRKINLKVVIAGALIYSLLCNLKDIKQGFVDGFKGNPTVLKSN